MIKGFFVFNDSGNSLIQKFYEFLTGEKKKLIIEKIYKAVEKLNDKSCNFFEDFGIYDGQSKIVARKYATLFFILVIDEDESELGILDLIQVIVESFDFYFENACEQDFIYHPDKINSIVDQIIVGGVVIETNSNEIIEALKALKILEKAV